MEKSLKILYFKTFCKSLGILGRVVEKSLTLEIRARCYGKVMEFEKWVLLVCVDNVKV